MIGLHPYFNANSDLNILALSYGTLLEQNTITKNQESSKSPAITGSGVYCSTTKPTQPQSMQHRSFPLLLSVVKVSSEQLTVSHNRPFMSNWAMSLDVGGLVLDSNVLERNLDVLLAKVHLRSEGAVGLPRARGAGCGLLKHLVDLFKGKTLGLRNEEVGEEDWHHVSL